MPLAEIDIGNTIQAVGVIALPIVLVFFRWWTKRDAKLVAKGEAQSDEKHEKKDTASLIETVKTENKSQVRVLAKIQKRRFKEFEGKIDTKLSSLTVDRLSDSAELWKATQKNTDTITDDRHTLSQALQKIANNTELIRLSQEKLGKDFELHIIEDRASFKELRETRDAAAVVAAAEKKEAGDVWPRDDQK